MLKYWTRRKVNKYDNRINNNSDNVEGEIGRNNVIVERNNKIIILLLMLCP